MADIYITCDQRTIEPKIPKKPSKAWREGFDAGVDAMLVALASVGNVRMIHGARVWLYADFNLEEIANAAKDRFRK